MEHRSCSFDIAISRPDHTVKWFLYDVEVVEGDKFMPKSDGLKFSLVINDCLIPDSGRVKVKVFNPNGDEVLRSSCKLTVTDLPVDVVKELENLKCIEKDEVYRKGAKQWLVFKGALISDIANFEIKVKDVNSRSKKRRLCLLRS